MEWQPIESAPTGTAILVYCPKIDNWNRPADMDSLIVVGIKREHRDSFSWVADLLETSPGYYGSTDIEPDYIQPTHWMPLPNPPGQR